MLVSYRVTSAWPAVGRASRVFRSFAGGSAEGLCGRIGGQRDCRNNPEQFRSQNAKRIGFLPGLITITSRFERPGLNLGRESREE